MEWYAWLLDWSDKMDGQYSFEDVAQWAYEAGREAGREAEREACAKIADWYAVPTNLQSGDSVAAEIAGEIRARNCDDINTKSGR